MRTSPIKATLYGVAAVCLNIHASNVSAASLSEALYQALGEFCVPQVYGGLSIEEVTPKIRAVGYSAGWEGPYVRREEWGKIVPVPTAEDRSCAVLVNYPRGPQSDIEDIVKKYVAGTSASMPIPDSSKPGPKGEITTTWKGASTTLRYTAWPKGQGQSATIVIIGTK